MSIQGIRDLHPTSIPVTDDGVSPRTAPPGETEAPPADEGSSWWIWLAIGIACLAVWLDVGPLSKDTGHPRSSGGEYESWIGELESRYSPLSEHQKRQLAVEMMEP